MARTPNPPQIIVSPTEETAPEKPKVVVRTMPGKNGGTLQVGNPGNKGGGRAKKYVEERATEILTDPQVWDVQLAMARSGDGRAVDRALERVLGKPKDEVEHTGNIVIEHIYEHREE